MNTSWRAVQKKIKYYCRYSNNNNNIRHDASKQQRLFKMSTLSASQVESSEIFVETIKPESLKVLY